MSLPIPYYSDDRAGITIYCGDHANIISQLGKFDLLLTDPPYGIGKRMSGGTWGSREKYSDFRSWDFRPSQEVMDFLVGVADTSVIWGGNYFAFPPSRCWLVWDKKNAVQTMADCELAWTNMDRPIKRLSLPVGVHSSGHPSEKPIRLFQWCILQVKSAETIIDPFMGSGTTLVAAKALGRRAIGIEREEKYCAVAVKRLAQEVLAL